MLLFLAIPGLILQIYIFIADDWTTWIIPFWVFYVTIWNNITVEYWKRKSSEINYRWGNMALISEGKEERIMRTDFVGYEMISEVTG